METNTVLDWILGGLAITILIGGMIMLLSGVSEMGDK
ncbi:NAD synthetase [Crocosphaera sp. XPORK-15E]|nr:NAD synthetase [Crocosphaera sp. XPORK-15E]MEA5535297.1 NAD synthetase [Crocosphaera sp. XPORK-15E]